MKAVPSQDGFSFLTEKMKIRYLFGLWIMTILCTFFSCVKEGVWNVSSSLLDSLNHKAYALRYKDLDESERLAQEALKKGKEFSFMTSAEALNNLGFCAFIRMDFERADSLFGEVYNETANELECLVADVGMMKICQRTSLNKEFYDYRNSALQRMKRIAGDEALTDERIRFRFNYARTEFYITSAVYYYYLQQEQQSLESMAEIQMEELEKDTAQWLYYQYMRGSGGLYVADTSENIVTGEFDCLMDCLMKSHDEGYVYFEANALQAMAELLKEEKNYRMLMEQRPGMMRIMNREDLSWEDLVLELSERAIHLFEMYGDWYQISGSYRTKASCLNEQGRYEDALVCLKEALSYVNLHHEIYYHCHDTEDRLKPYVPLATHSIELEWINKERIKTVPEWIARFREQLSVTYAALGMKPESDYNRNIYLDILDYTRQDKELESRYQTLEKESGQLTLLLVLVIAGIIVLVLLLWIWNRHWRIHYKKTISKLETTLDICRRVTASVPSHAEEMKDVVDALMNVLKERTQSLIGPVDMGIHVADNVMSGEEPSGACTEFPLYTTNKNLLGVWKIYSLKKLTKDDVTLLKVISPYISWTLENGLALISLGDKRKMLEKEQYVHQQHLVQNKRLNVVKKACMSIVMGITPYIDRVVNEVHKLVYFDYLSDQCVKKEKLQYISELIERINEYNDILALWIKMRQGSLNLNIENFELNTLFDVLQKSRRTFEAKGLTFSVQPTDALVKADKALTLFMINTLADNARKYTPRGGEVCIYTTEGDDYVEISVQDNGVGLVAEDVQSILGEKVYDSGRIGMQSSVNPGELKRKKGYGFGLMNCKGIIEKYRKTNELFRVCRFHIESEPGKGSRFSFRLPKGIRKVGGICMMLGLLAVTGCRSDKPMVGNSLSDSLYTATVMGDSLLMQANEWANHIYEANLLGNYRKALMYADSAISCLNVHAVKYAGSTLPILVLRGEGSASEIEWFSRRFDTDYYALLDIRNEVAVACLALGDWEGYRYNNQAYTALYKQISVDASLEQYCKRMEHSANQKFVAIVLCIILLIVFLLGYYLLYFRHLLSYRYNLEQVMDINRQIFALPIYDVNEKEVVVSLLITPIYRGLNELIPMDLLGIGLYDEELRSLCSSFSSDEEEISMMKEMMEVCWKTRQLQKNTVNRMRVVPLCVELGGEMNCVGVLAFRSVYDTYRKEDNLMVDLVAGYMAVVIYHAIEVVAQKRRDIELTQDENRRVLREENLLYIQNQVLDNCLSTIKHETIYYPNRIKQIVERLKTEPLESEEKNQVAVIRELVAYYKEMFTILSSCAARQMEEVTFRRERLKAKSLAYVIDRYVCRIIKRASLAWEWKMEVDNVEMIGDVVQLNFLLENLVNEAATCKEPGVIELHIYKKDAFVRFDFIDRRRTFSQDELNSLFYPHLSKMKKEDGDMLEGTEYLICKQIIRDHDEFAGQRGCRINAQPVEGGGFMVWFTVPSR